MSIVFQCNGCGRTMRVKPEMAGKKAKCPGCEKIVTIPAASGSASPVTKPAAPSPVAAARPAAKSAPPPPAPAPAPAPAAAAGGMVACACGAKIRTKPEWAGKTIKCPKCEARLKVPAAGPAPAPAPAAPARKPAPPPPPADDPFGQGGFGDASDDPFAGDNASFGQDSFGGDSFGGDEDNEVPVTAPASRAKAKAAPPPPKKKGGRWLLYSLLGLILVGGGAFAAWAFLLDDQPLVIPAPKQIAKVTPKDDDGEMPEPNDPPKTGAKTDDPDAMPPKKDPADTEPEPKTEPKTETPIKKDPVDVAPPAAGAVSPFDLIAGDSLAFIHLKPQAFFKTDLGQKFLAGLDETSPPGAIQKQIRDAFGVGLTDIVEIAGGLSDVPDPSSGASPIKAVIIAFAKPINPAGFTMEVAGKSFVKKDADGVAYYVDADPANVKKSSAWLAGPNVVVMGDEADVLKAIAGRNSPAGALSPLMKSAAAGKHLLFVGFQLPDELGQNLLNGSPPDSREMVEPFVAVKTGHLTLVEDETVKALLKLDFEDPEKAAKVKAVVDGLLIFASAAIPEMKKGVPAEFAKQVEVAEAAFKSIVPLASGKSVEVPLHLNVTLGQLGELVMPIGMQFLGGKAPDAPKLDLPKETPDEPKSDVPLEKKPAPVRPKIDPFGNPAKGPPGLGLPPGLSLPPPGLQLPPEIEPPAEPDPKQPAPKPADPKDATPKDPAAKDPEPKLPLPGEPEPKIPDPKEIDPKTPEPKEPEPTETSRIVSVPRSIAARIPAVVADFSRPSATVPLAAAPGRS